MFRERRQEILSERIPGGESMMARRKRILCEIALQQSVAKSGIGQLQAYFQKVQGIIARASNGEEVPSGR